MSNLAGPCRLCGSDDLVALFAKNDFELVRCRRCTYVQIVREPSAEELSEIYGDSYFTSSKYQDGDTLARENARRLRLLDRYLEPGAAVLDAGCATGDFVAAAKDRYQMAGYDLSEFAVSEARQANPELAAKLWSGRLENVDFRGESFDAVCLWDVIEHLWDPVQICQQLSDHIEPHGMLFVSTPDIGSFTARFSGSRWAFMTPPEHMGFFGETSFSHLFGEVLPMSIAHRHCAGKWTNLGFLLYKLKRMFPALVPARLINSAARRSWGKIPVYVPTGDIQYLAVRRN